MASVVKSVRLPIDLWVDLEAEAAESGEAVNAVVVRILRKSLQLQADLDEPIEI